MHARDRILDGLIHGLDIAVSSLRVTLRAGDTTHLAHLRCRVRIAASTRLVDCVLVLWDALLAEGLVVHRIESVDNQAVFVTISIQVLFYRVSHLTWKRP